ncbi:MAG: NIPSNAP family protein [Candidatus Binatia bacterium]
MIYELRTYQLTIGALPEFLEMVKNERLPVLAEHGLKPLGFWYTEIGTLSEVVHLWAYEDLNERQQKWGKDQRDPRTGALIRKIAPLIVSMSTKILSPTEFSAMK